MSGDPWQGMARPSDATVLSARRVSTAGRWGFYWAVDSALSALLVLEVPFLPSASGVRWPTLRGLEVRTVREGGRDPERVVLRLRDSALRDTFRELCQALIEVTEAVAEPRDALLAFEQGLWRWHSLLRGGRAALSLREQAGLWGELKYLIELGAVRGYDDAVDAWRGPERGVHDFVTRGADVEVKTVVGDDSDAGVHISSEFQLERVDNRPLFLRVYRVELDEVQDPTASSAFDLAETIKGQLDIMRTEARFKRLSALAGLDAVPASAYRFRRVLHPLDIAVCGSMPRIVPGAVAKGVGGISYSISLTALMPFGGATEEMRALGLTTQEST